jgi:queuine tRNA-ribosyltransferase
MEEQEEYGKPFTRAYVHYLLHKHEMSANTLSVMHKLGVVERFFSSIRAFLASSPSLVPNPMTLTSSDAGVQRTTRRFR